MAASVEYYGTQRGDVASTLLYRRPSLYSPSDIENREISLEEALLPYNYCIKYHINLWHHHFVIKCALAYCCLCQRPVQLSCTCFVTANDGIEAPMLFL